jgi:uncharacterized protein
MRGITATGFLVLAWCCLCGVAKAAAEGGKIVVQGSGTVEVVPDVADIVIGITNEEPTPGQAIDSNSAAMKRVIDDAKRAGVAERDVQTNMLHLNGVRDGKNVLRYRAVNTVRIRVRDLPRLGVIARDLVGAGANELHGIRYAAADPMPHLDQARRQAVADAKRRAEILAQAAGGRLGEVLEIDESASDDPGVVAEARAALRQAVPVEPGQMALRATVRITWRFEP